MGALSLIARGTGCALRSQTDNYYSHAGAGGGDAGKNIVIMQDVLSHITPPSNGRNFPVPRARYPAFYRCPPFPNLLVARLVPSRHLALILVPNLGKYFYILLSYGSG